MSIEVVAREVKSLPQLSDLHPLLQRVFAARGIQDVSQIEYDLKKLLPFVGLKGLPEAVARLYQALSKQETVTIIGDFDADGATSTTLAVSALRAFGLRAVSYLVPNRFEYGYGLTPEIVDLAAKEKPDLLITVDNGISSIAGAARAKSLGIDVIITDHHLPGDELPDVVALVNPNQVGCPFASKNLAGVGVIFYVMLAFRRLLLEENWFEKNHLPPVNMGQFLDLVALGTVADVVPLDGNNRVLVHQGLARIKAGRARPGILALLEIGKRPLHQLSASDMGFAVAPRLNAAGRLTDMSCGIECLLTGDVDVAKRYAKELDQLNQKRKAIELSMRENAELIIDDLTLLHNKKLPLGICLYDESWHQGVIGILAGRIKEKTQRPVIVFANVSETEVKGSARSIPAVHIRDVLERVATEHPGIINKFGGHAMAAGLSLSPADLPTFANLFAKTLESIISESDLKQEYLTDGALTDSEMTLDTARLLKEAGPWGQTFPEPVFEGHFQVVQQRLLGDKHLKLLLKSTESDNLYNAIAFNVDRAHWPNPQKKFIDVLYRLDVNEYQGAISLQLMVEHLIVD